ncbi:hypothetical protein [Paenibacillus durus]|uniref:Uncharacterized protein n=1 Tax=Paenibacillus durus ATCC 35681 TaxID=1333534 RepID=A0A0F7CHP2_PAEDU|nr:hypothetical protein [Paenibacillus durus]AKG34666.1 hypothetical protein VK70_08810 [Paenibacillus durus ATCC 35681]
MQAKRLREENAGTLNVIVRNRLRRRNTDSGNNLKLLIVGNVVKCDRADYKQKRNLRQKVPLVFPLSF